VTVSFPHRSIRDSETGLPRFHINEKPCACSGALAGAQ